MLVPRLPRTLLAEALAAASTMTNEGARTQTLRLLAPALAAQSIDRIAWHRTIRALAAHGRPAFLRDLAALAPWLVALAAPADLSEIATAVDEVSHCWP